MIARIVGFGFLGAAVTFSSCERSPKRDLLSGNRAEQKNSAAEHAAVENNGPLRPTTRNAYAVWYNVPPNSLARRRAGINELTAAHNRLPIGTLVRVTHLGNGKSTIVRITDRGVTGTKAKIDLCKEAAEQLDMVAEGIARVRMEILPDDEGSALAKGQLVREPASR